jgi:hypothetical protein
MLEIYKDRVEMFMTEEDVLRKSFKMLGKLFH